MENKIYFKIKPTIFSILFILVTFVLVVILFLQIKSSEELAVEATNKQFKLISNNIKEKIFIKSML